VLATSAFFLSGTQTASAIDITTEQSLIVDDVWLSGDILNIAVTDNTNGESRVMELLLSDYAQPSDEYVTIQATDSNGRLSNTFQFKNPHYKGGADEPQPDSGNPIPDTNKSAAPDKKNPIMPDGGEDMPYTGDFLDSDETNHFALLGGEPIPDTCESALPDETNPFTPDGTGTVIDNATDGDGKEFFNIETPDGNVFYLVIDRQRSRDNVYLLNAVTEQELIALAKPGDGSVNDDTPVPPGIPEPEPQVEEEPAAPEKPPEKGGGKGSIIIIVVAVIAVGGAGYYFKIVRPKQNGGMDDDDYEDEPETFDDDTEVDMENSEEDDNE